MDSSWPWPDDCWDEVMSSYGVDMKELDRFIEEFTQVYSEDLGAGFPADESTGKRQRCGIGKVLKVPINLGEDEDGEDGDFRVPKYGMGKVLKLPITHGEDEDESEKSMGEDEEVDFSACTIYGVGKVWKGPIHLGELDPFQEVEDEERGDFPMCTKYGVGKVLKLPASHDFGEDLDDDEDFPKKRWLVDWSNVEEHDQSSKKRAPPDLKRSKPSSKITKATNKKDSKKQSTVHQRIMRKIQSLRSKSTVRRRCT